MADKRQEIFEALKQQLVERGVDGDKVTFDADLVQDLGMDSLDTVEVTMSLEERYEVEIDDSELEDVSTVGDAVGLVQSKLAVGT